MKKTFICLIIINFFLSSLNAQNLNTINGKIVDNRTGKYLQGVEVTIQNDLSKDQTNSNGEFQIVNQQSG